MAHLTALRDFHRRLDLLSTPRQETGVGAEEIFVSLLVFEAVLHEVAWLLAQIGAVWGWSCFSLQSLES